MRTLFLLVFMLFATLASAQTCPPSADANAERSRLMEQLAKAPDEASSKTIADQIWRMWTKAPDERAQALLDRGMQRREAYDFEEAEKVLDALIAYCPDYVEGYNQRAFVRFLRENYDKSLEDLDIALEKMPDHFAAMSGKALVLMNQGRMELGQKVLREALKLNPWLKERGMLLPIPGQKI
ncbi:MAG: tetratricopeptide repeat protein [Nitratireductor sp.]